MQNNYNFENHKSVLYKICSCFLVATILFFGAYLWDKNLSSVVFPKKVISKQDISKQNISINRNNNQQYKYTRIADVKVGDRAVGINPEITEIQRTTFLPDPDPSSWCKLTMEMIKADGKRILITLLRPLEWFEEVIIIDDTAIFLDLPEMGIQGNVQILEIDPCPTIQAGKGNIITGTFAHESANVIDLYVECLDKPIGTTNNHPFWSVTRQEFVDAGKLQQGEELQLYNGQTTKVVQILPRPGPESVYNLEVHNEHVYHVTNNGILVHNVCGGDPPQGMQNPHNHHIVMKGKFKQWKFINRIYVIASQLLLRKYGIDVANDPRNRTWAENAGHSVEYAKKVWHRLSKIQRKGRSTEEVQNEIYKELDKMAVDISNGEF
jgi:hypothetical protein